MEQLLDECDELVFELKQSAKFDQCLEVLNVVYLLNPDFIIYELWYQSYIYKFSDAYFAISPMNVGKSFYYYCLYQIMLLFCCYLYAFHRNTFHRNTFHRNNFHLNKKLILIK